MRYVSAILLVALVLVAGCGGGGSSYFEYNSSLFSPNYISDLDALYTWGRLPIRVAFTLPSDWSGYGSNQDFYVEAAYEWNQPGRQAMISVVPAGQSADVTVDFVYQSELGGSIYGRTYNTADSAGYMRASRIEVAYRTSLSDPSLISATDVGTVIAHELGHALGMDGHSETDENDLMYESFVLGTDKDPNSRDLNTAMTAYAGYFGALTMQRATEAGPVTLRHWVIE
ncbi:MAG: matrixin family metalloprotease [Armatimonadota bacterium]